MKIIPSLLQCPLPFHQFSQLLPADPCCLLFNLSPTDRRFNVAVWEDWLSLSGPFCLSPLFVCSGNWLNTKSDWANRGSMFLPPPFVAPPTDFRVQLFRGGILDDGGCPPANSTAAIADGRSRQMAPIHQMPIALWATFFAF